MEKLRLYDINRKISDFSINRRDIVPKGFYFRSVSVWVINNYKEYLIAKRHYDKSYPKLWECPGGLLIDDENVLAGAVREVREEVDIKINENDLIFLLSKIIDKREIHDVYLVKVDSFINIKLQKEEFIEYKWVNKKELIDMYKKNELAPWIDYIENKL